MACNDFLGSALLGMQQGQQSAFSGLAQQQGAFHPGQIVTTTANTIFNNCTAISEIRDVGRSIAIKVLTLREELQADVDEWLPKL